MVCRIEAERFELWLVDGWNHEDDEPAAGGQFLDCFETQEAAMRAYDLHAGRRLSRLMRRMRQSLRVSLDHVVILDGDGRLKYGPTLPSCRYAGAA